MSNDQQNASSTRQVLTQADLRQFTGDDVRYKTLKKNVVYTPGVQYVAQAGGAYWLIDAIVSYFNSPVMNSAMRNDYRIESIQFWRLDVHTDHSAVLTARADSDVEPFITQHIEFTDFPLSSVEIWAGFDGIRWILYLPSEH